jgi:hypothetical protein
MRLLIITLLIISFIQSSITTVDIVVVLLVAKAFRNPELTDYWLAFGFGMLISFLAGQILGLMSIYYLIVVFLSHIVARSRLSNNWLIIIPVAFGFFLVKEYADYLVSADSLSWRNVIVQLLLVIPTYIGLLFLDERVIGRSESRLKIKN